MSNKFSNIKERILYLLENKGVVKDKFFKEIGMTYGNFTGEAKKTPLNSTAISNIFSKFPDVNLEWLLTGNGQMLKVSSHLNMVEEPGAEYQKPSPKPDELAEMKVVITSMEEKMRLMEDKMKLLEEKVTINKKLKYLKDSQKIIMQGVGNLLLNDAERSLEKDVKKRKEKKEGVAH